MSDFWQHGPITTIHRLPGPGIGALRAMLGAGSRRRPPALLIPALASEMDGPAWPVIMEELKRADYLAEVVLALGRASRKDLDRAKGFLDDLPARATVVWPESENLAPVLEKARPEVDVGPPGKGRDVWIALGYLAGRRAFHAVALHDADIVTFTEEIPLRLLAPLVHPELRFAFCKGFYARVSGALLAGRVTRLLVVPLVSVLVKEAFTPALRTIGAMRYALAGEFSMTMELASRIPVPRDWGLEVGILSAVARAVGFEGVCQVDLCENYDHKHQEVHPEDTTRGLNRMAVEVSAALLREVASPPQDLPARYREAALALAPRFRADALANGLSWDEDAEMRAIEVFTRALEKAMGLKEADVPGPLPSWEETKGRVPGLARAIVEAVERDNA
ncbi:MAG: glycosyl transferase [bacterium]|nr:MAG: glycosyl transferase [bacterium]